MNSAPIAIQGIWRGQNERVDELNSRIADRQFPDQAPQPNFNARPSSTRYSLFPVIDRRQQANVPIQPTPMYNCRQHFMPATANGPVSTYLANVDLETVLQNRHVVLQRGADQGVYVPSSKSDLYGFAPVGRQESMGERELLFQRNSDYNTKTPEIARMIGQDRFNNNTRVQLRNT
jgi:hypothetical protein